MLRTDWDYTNLAKHYDKRAPYSDAAIDQLLSQTSIEPAAKLADIGAGTGMLSVPLARRGFSVCAIEPNDEMRRFGETNTRGLPVTWYAGTGEQTGLASDTYGLVTFGSSFNVVDQAKALREARRILVSRGWFACMWNHRDLSDPLQADIEIIIRRHVTDYAFGTRRDDQSAAIADAGLFSEVTKIEGRFVSRFDPTEYLEAWRSHATLERQAGDKFDAVIASIAERLGNGEVLSVPYTTRIWFARLLD